MIGITVNLYLGAIILLVAFILLAYGFWRWEKASRWGVRARVGTLCVLGIIYFNLFGFQIRSQYRRDHSPVNVVLIPKPTISPAPAPPLQVPERQAATPESKKPNPVKSAIPLKPEPRPETPNPAGTNSILTGSVTVQPGGVASIGQQGGITAGQVNVYGTNSGPIKLTANQDGNTITISTNRRIDSLSVRLFFDADITGWSMSVRCSQRCMEGGRWNDSSGKADLKTIWTGWGQAFPALTPDHPLEISLSASSPARLLRFEWEDRPPF